MLGLGDIIWVGRTNSGIEIVLDYVIERKIISDLCHSIIGGRYKGMPSDLTLLIFLEQKFRLSKSGISTKIYLVEGTPAEFKTQQQSLTRESIESALANTQLEGFLVLRTKTLQVARHRD